MRSSTNGTEVLRKYYQGQPVGSVPGTGRGVSLTSPVRNGEHPPAAQTKASCHAGPVTDRKGGATALPTPGTQPAPRGWAPRQSPVEAEAILTLLELKMAPWERPAEPGRQSGVRRAGGPGAEQGLQRIQRAARAGPDAEQGTGTERRTQGHTEPETPRLTKR